MNIDVLISQQGEFGNWDLSLNDEGDLTGTDSFDSALAYSIYGERRALASEVPTVQNRGVRSADSVGCLDLECRYTRCSGERHHEAGGGSSLPNERRQLHRGHHLAPCKSATRQWQDPYRLADLLLLSIENALRPLSTLSAVPSPDAWISRKHPPLERAASQPGRMN